MKITIVFPSTFFKLELVLAYLLSISSQWLSYAQKYIKNQEEVSVMYNHGVLTVWQCFYVVVSGIFA